MFGLPVWILLGLWVVVLAFLVFANIRDGSQRGHQFGVPLFLSIVFAGLIFISLAISPGLQWGVLLACLPPVIILSHAIFVGLFRQKEVAGRGPALPTESQSHLTGAIQVIDSARSRFFSPVSLGIRYGLPALLLLGIGLVGFPFLFDGTMESLLRSMTCMDASKVCKLVAAARLGCAGSYVYVLTYLGERNFRHDVTSGGAMWCVATIVLGPILAVILALVWVEGSTEGFTGRTVYFAAGLAPRQIASWLMEAVRRLQQSSGAMTDTPRILPLSKIRGITKTVEARLQEEGIEDVYTLAMANPLWLLRNTPYGKRQIVDWIDEAMLIKVAPQGWEALERRGITGVIDLAYLRDQKCGLPELRGDLSKDAGLTEAELDALIERLYVDKQVQVLWALYQIDHELPDEGSSSSEAPA